MEQTVKQAHIQTLCIPRELRPKILSLLHDTRFTWHVGVRKMYEDAIRHFWWNNIYKDMQNDVSSCKLCLKTNTGHSPKIPLNPLEIPSAHFQTIHVVLLKFHTPSKGEKTHSGNYRCVFKICYHKSNLKNSVYSDQINL